MIERFFQFFRFWVFVKIELIFFFGRSSSEVTLTCGHTLALRSRSKRTATVATTATIATTITTAKQKKTKTTNISRQHFSYIEKEITFARNTSKEQEEQEEQKLSKITKTVTTTIMTQSGEAPF